MFPGKHDNYGIFCKKTYDFFATSEQFEITGFSGICGKSYNKLWNILRYCILLFSILKNLTLKIRNFDIIYVQYVWKHAFFVTHFLRRIEKNKKRIFINFHGEDLTNYDLLSLNEKEQFKKLCIFAAGIVVPSVYFKNLLCKTTGLVLDDKIIVTPSGGVNSTVFFKKNICADNTIIYCSRFDKDKGWDDFISAAKKLVSVRSDIKFKMIGYGRETDSVKELIVQNDVQKNIELLINPPQNIIAESYTNAALFIFPTRLAESLGLVALEAMSCGLPAICSNIGAISEYIKDGINGFLYEPGNIEELTNCIIKYFDLPIDERKYFSEEAIKIANTYSDENVEEEFLANIFHKS